MQKYCKMWNRLITLKASASDDMQVIFYHRSWNIMGKSVCDMVRLFSNSGHMLKQPNWTYVTFIGKINILDSVGLSTPIILRNI